MWIQGNLFCLIKQKGSDLPCQEEMEQGLLVKDHQPADDPAVEARPQQMMYVSVRPAVRQRRKGAQFPAIQCAAPNVVSR